MKKLSIIGTKLIFVLLSLLLVFSSCCKEPDFINAPECIEDTYILKPFEAPYDTMFQFPDSLLYPYPDQYKRRYFIASGFTPNGDGINDELMINVSCQPAIASIVPDTFSMFVTIFNAGKIIYTQSLNFQFGGFVFWNGKNLDGKLVQDIYDVKVKVYKNGQYYDEFRGKTWLLLTDATNQLPNWSQCLLFGDLNDSRLGLESNTKTKEQFAD
jgi:hypothetical protein